MKITDRLRNIFISIDQTIFVIVTVGAAYPDETISAASWRLEQENKWGGKIFRPIIDWIFANLPFGYAVKNHCYQAYLSEKRHTQNHADYR